MKKIIIYLFSAIIFTVQSSAQDEHADTPLYNPHRTSIARRFVNENIYLVNKDFRWRYINVRLANISTYSRPQGFFRTDFVEAGNAFLHTSILSLYTFDYPMKISKSEFYEYLIYALPIGLRLPVLSGRNYDLSLSCDYYWHINSNKEERDSMYYILHVEPAITTFKRMPDILDSRLNLNLYFYRAAGLSLFWGYRKQFRKWYATELGKEIYSNNITGNYIGFSLSVCISLRSNEGIQHWESAKNNNTYSSYSSFLSRYPDSHYENEARQRQENALYMEAVKGKMEQSNDYLEKYPKGKYTGQVKRLLEKHESNSYDAAVVGSIADCENYLKIYPDGKYAENVKKLIIEKQDKIEADDYSTAIAGGVDECENYLKKYPDGKYVAMVIAEKESKIEKHYYQIAIEHGYEQCDHYLNKYPNGKYVSEVRALRKDKFEKAEEDTYLAVLAGNYNECKKYMKIFPGGKHSQEVDQQCLKMKYGLNSPSQFLVLENPGYDKIEILNNSFTEEIRYNYDVVVMAQAGDFVTVNATTITIEHEVEIIPLSDVFRIVSSFGKPNTRIDITLMQDGFEYNDKIWYPTSKRDAVIICIKDKIMGHNVRYVSK